MSGPQLSFRNLSVSLSKRTIVRDVSADFPSSGLVALLGPNGAGKTTLVKAIVGLAPSSGRIEIGGEDAATLSPATRAQRIGYLPQGHVTHWPLPARDIVALGRYAHGSRDPSRLNEKDIAAVESAMEATGTVAFADRPVTELSGGERARIALARVLASETPVILADEPIASLDPHYQLSVMAVLKDMAGKGRLVIVVMHDLSLAWRYADRIIVMHQGGITSDGPAESTLTPELLKAVFGVSAEWIPHGDRTILATVAAVDAS
ncbi:ABC transporter ATP-binding protein [Terrarubrum flagellatum]|uniref:ABC transporter ATP-binding protein n=1 Tax=Terrirubrum flagellatum TaxID=2895980 RepID=UPI003145606E